MTFRDTAVAHEQDFYHLFYSSYVLYFFSNACYYPIAKSLKHLCSLICFRRSRPCFPPMSSLVTGSCNTADAISKSNGFLRIRSLSPAIWNAGLRTHRIGCSELSPLPLTWWDVISHALVFRKRIVAMRCLPNASFSRCCRLWPAAVNRGHPFSKAHAFPTALKPRATHRWLRRDWTNQLQLGFSFLSGKASRFFPWA